MPKSINTKLPPKKLPVNMIIMPKEIKDWMKHLDDNFLEIVLENMDGTNRSETAISIQNRMRLSPRQNMSVIHSINFHTYKFIGSVRPDMSLCRILALLLEQKLPETFNDCIKDKKKGEGGKGDLALRISDIFYKTLVRQ